MQNQQVLYFRVERWLTQVQKDIAQGITCVEQRPVISHEQVLFYVDLLSPKTFCIKVSRLVTEIVDEL